MGWVYMSLWGQVGEKSVVKREDFADLRDTLTAHICLTFTQRTPPCDDEFSACQATLSARQGTASLGSLPSRRSFTSSQDITHDRSSSTQMTRKRTGVKRKAQQFESSWSAPLGCPWLRMHGGPPYDNQLLGAISCLMLTGHSQLSRTSKA